MLEDTRVIQFRQVWKKFKRGRKLLLKEALLDIFKPGSTETFWALKNVSFDVLKGEMLGIIGANGSGKSTILKLIVGVMVPDKGEVKVKGKIAPLIELGAGFHPELSGRENIYLNGAILGVAKKSLDRKYNDIVEFSGLSDFIDTPVKHYSSGMYMRLGFAIAVHTDPDILLVDEILAVGDTAFQKKCLQRIEQFKRKGVTILFISHDLDVVSKYCDRVLYIDEGEVKKEGITEEVLKEYGKKSF